MTSARPTIISAAFLVLSPASLAFHTDFQGTSSVASVVHQDEQDTAVAKTSFDALLRMQKRLTVRSLNESNH
jgi:hypothetical protein